MLSWNTPRQSWEKIPDLTTSLEQSICDEVGLAYQRYDYLTITQGIDPNDDRVCRTDAYITGLEKLLDWSE